MQGNLHPREMVAYRRPVGTEPGLQVRSDSSRPFQVVDIPRRNDLFVTTVLAPPSPLVMHPLAMHPSLGSADNMP